MSATDSAYVVVAAAVASWQVAIARAQMRARRAWSRTSAWYWAISRSHVLLAPSCRFAPLAL